MTFSWAKWRSRGRIEGGPTVPERTWIEEKSR
jgi:hypothetical protein